MDVVENQWTADVSGLGLGTESWLEIIYFDAESDIHNVVYNIP